MTESRWKQFAGHLRELSSDVSEAERICQVTEHLLEGASTSISVVLNGSYAPAAQTSPLAVLLDETQFRLGDGPVFMVQSSTAPIVVDDLYSHRATATYPAFAPVATSHGIRSISTFPLVLGLAPFGTVTVYRNHAGAISADQYADGLVAASFALANMVNSQAGVPGDQNAQDFTPAQFANSTLHTAAGMVAEALNISIVESMVRIRAHAFAEDTPVSEVARQITRRDITLLP